MKILRLLAAASAAAAAGGLAVPALAQSYPYPQAYPQHQYPQAYPQTGYAYPGQQGYSQNPVGAIINQLLGNRYNVTDRNAVSLCASAAMTQAAARHQGRGYNGYGGYAPQPYAPQHAYMGHSNARVTAITDVQRRNNGLRVSGLINSGMHGAGYPPYGHAYGYHSQRQAAADLSFRCNVAYNGQVTNVRISRTSAWRG